MSKHISRRGVLLGAASAFGAPLLLPESAAAQQSYTGYLMAHFTGESSDGEQIYLAHSGDGLHWSDLNSGGLVLRSNIGTAGVRDPALVRSPSGDRYWIVATDLRIASGISWYDAANNGSTALVVWESTDLVNWSEPRLLDVAGSIGDAGCAWAPEAIWDSASGDYVVYWATNSTLNGVKKHRVWYARTGDFRSASAPQLYVDRPGSEGVIDTQIIEVPGSIGGWRYYRASRDDRITIEASNSITGSWTHIGNLDHLGDAGNGVEGPMWAKFNDRDEWALWNDRYTTGSGYIPITSTNLGSTQNFQRVGGYDLGGTLKRHGSILNLTAAEESRVLDRWGGGSANRLQSYNFPDRYVRHADFDLRIDPNPSPAQDAQFRLVAGLADSGGVSFESVNFPGRYIRHWDFDLQLEENDGSGAFADDATFHRVAGLADGSWSSFRSHNYPDRHIRHYGYLLRIDEITDATGREDATFRIT
ncbi:glycoside hydrolase family 43 protein [Glycomyces salinus]|uniref:glycoside hydrolase family 43 protein n=1 Tax=Glycomyces salinus TaxID=980294 RepID=UPI0018EB8B4E|nr:glycoside hydrolase family 43 protein [Glycomyces salinus]